MAIQISGTTVVNNSRQLQNIASLDSTTTNTIAAAAGGGWSQYASGSVSGNNFALTVPDKDFVKVLFKNINQTYAYTQDYMRFRRVGSSSVDSGSNYSETGTPNTTAIQITPSSNNYYNTPHFVELDLYLPRQTTQGMFGKVRMIHASTSNNNTRLASFIFRPTTGVNQLSLFNFNSASYTGNYEIWTL